MWILFDGWVESVACFRVYGFVEVRWKARAALRVEGGEEVAYVCVFL